MLCIGFYYPFVKEMIKNCLNIINLQNKMPPPKSAFEAAETAELLISKSLLYQHQVSLIENERE